MKKIYFFLAIPFMTILLQLCNLFFWHVNQATFIPKKFIHGFESSYSVKISGLDLSLLDSIFSQDFYFLGQGKQMIAFASQDGCFVLKLFYPMRPLKEKWYAHGKYWKEYFSLKWIFREQFQKKARLKKLFLRHKLAFEKLPEETGILFAHLSSCIDVSHTVTLFDKKGKKYFLNLTDTPFILQKKAILVPEYFASLFKQNAISEVKQAVTALENLLMRRLEEGITDRIQTMGNNYGFINAKPIQIDVGRIRFDEGLILAPEKEKTRVLTNFHTWLHTQFPQI